MKINPALILRPHYRYHRHLLLPLLVLLTLISGCTGPSQHLGDTLEVAVFGVRDQRATVDYAHSLPYASMYVSMNKEPSVLVVLGWDEVAADGQTTALKWVSGQQEMLVTENGRITKTVNLVVGNMINIIAEQPDPLQLGLLNQANPQLWNYQLRWQDNQQQIHQQPAVSTFTVHGLESKTLPDGERALIKVDEQVHLPLSGQSYHNVYWLTPESGDVFASRQQLGPNGVILHLAVAKPYAGGQ